MNTDLLDNWLAPFMVPAIMLIESCNLKTATSNHKLLYGSVTLAIVLGTVCGYINFKLRSKRYFALISTSLTTLTCALSLKGCQIIHQGGSISDYFIPGLIIFSATQVSAFLTNELVFKCRQRKFTISEGTTIAQLVSAAYTIFALVHYSKFTGHRTFVIRQTNEILLACAAIIVVTSLIVPRFILRSKGTIYKYGLLLVSFAGSYLVFLVKANRNPFDYIYNFIFDETPYRLWLCFLWLIISLLCIGFACVWSS